jgi:hypothetical protein
VTGVVKLLAVVPLTWLVTPTLIEEILADVVNVATRPFTLVPYGMVTPIVPDVTLTIGLENTCPGKMKVAASVFTLVKEGLVKPEVPPLTIVLEPTCPGILYAVISAAVEGALTVIPLCVPLMEAVTVSVAVTDCVPAVFKVTPFVKVCVPESNGTKV